MGKASGRRNFDASPSRRWAVIIGVVVIVAALAVTGVVKLTGTGGTRAGTAASAAAGRTGTAQAGAERVTRQRSGNSSVSQGQGQGQGQAAGGGPAGGLSAIAAGRVAPPVMGALDRARHFPKPTTSSAAGRFNVGEPHSPELLRKLAGPLDRTGRGARAAAPSGTASPSPSITPAQTPSPAASGTAAARTTALTVPASGTSGTMPQGIDVASFQHPNGAAIDWKQVAGAGYVFAAVKATEGNYYTNPYYAADVSQAKAAGLFVTGYHFAIPNVSSAVDQADYAVENGGYTGDGHTLPLELDVEYDPYTSTDHTNECYGLTASQMVSWISAFEGEAQRLTGQVPIIYTTADWWKACTGNSTAFASSQLWIASYAASSPVLPAAWSQWTFWQYTSGGTVPGVSGSTDVSYFNSGLTDLVYPGTQRDAPGVTVSLQVNSLNAAAGQSLSFSASGLPAGLSISAGGLITGTVTAPAGAYKVVITATGTAGTGSVGFVWEVPGTVTVTSPAAQNTTIGGPAGLQIAASDTASGYAPSFTATGLPPGVAISAGGRVTGWPDAPGSYTVRVTATDALQATGSATFSWTVASAADQGPAGPVKLQNGGKCLDDPSGRTADGTRIQIWNCLGNANQRWTVAQDGTLRINGRCLSAAGTGDKAAIELNGCNGSGSQRWQAGTDGELVNPAAGRCLDDPGFSTRNGTLMDLWSCNGGANQHWTPAAAAMLSGLPGKCADDPGYDTGNGTRLDLWSCNGGGNQHWTVQPDGTIRLAGKCVDIVGYGTASGSLVDLWTCRGTGNQKWKLVPEGPVGSEVVNPVSGRCLADTGDSTANGTKLTIQNCSAADPGTVWHVLS